MAAQKTGLGRGLDALLDPYSVTVEEQVKSGAGILSVNVRDIDTNALQPRKQFEETSLNELAESIRVHGIVQPLIVKQKGSRYMIIAGERRFQACKTAGIEKIPAMVKDISDADAFKISLVENLQREDLNPMEEAEAFFTLKDQFRLTHQDIAAAVNKDRSTVTNSMRLVNLPVEAKTALKEGVITTGHARAILMAEGITAQVALLGRIVDGGLSVRDAERLASVKGRKRKQGKKKDPYLEDLSSQLGDRLGARVLCSWGKSRGRIVISVGSRDEMKRIAAELCRQESPL